MLKRHKIIWSILRPFVIIFLYIKFGYTFKTAKNLPSNFILLSNHNTDFDPIFVGVSFRQNIRFVASEHISRWKHAFKFLDYAFAPIMRSKGTNAASTVKEMLKTTRAGYNIGLFAEGARSWNGVTAPILPSTGKVVKSSKCALVTYKITGGYFVSPMWSSGGTRKGKIHGEIVNVYTKEQIAEMSVDEINEIIRRDLHEDAYETQKTLKAKYKGKQIAVEMESMLYACPQCNDIDTLFSSDNVVMCRSCYNHFFYNEYGDIEGLDQSNIKELFLWLKEKAEADAKANVKYESLDANLITVENHIETPISSGTVSLDKDSLVCGDYSINICDIEDCAMHGRYSLVFSTKDTYYEMTIPQQYSTLKFYMLFQAHKYGSVNKFNF